MTEYTRELMIEGFNSEENRISYSEAMDYLREEERKIKADKYMPFQLLLSLLNFEYIRAFRPKDGKPLLKIFIFIKPIRTHLGEIVVYTIPEDGYVDLHYSCEWSWEYRCDIMHGKMNNMVDRLIEHRLSNHHYERRID